MPWPAPVKKLVDEKARQEMGLVMEVIRSIRNLRSEIGLSPGRNLPLSLELRKIPFLFADEKIFIEKLAWSEPVSIIKIRKKNRPVP